MAKAKAKAKKEVLVERVPVGAGRRYMKPKKAAVKKPAGRRVPANKFPAGNKFWELRTSVGRDTLFSSPEDMWKAACEYFEWCENHPLIEIDYVGKNAKKVEKPKMRAFTWQGLCLYLDCTIGYFWDFEKRENEKGEQSAFSVVLSRIRETIYTQKFVGAASGFLNHNIIVRDLGLIDKKQQEIRTEQPLFGDE